MKVLEELGIKEEVEEVLKEASEEKPAEKDEEEEVYVSKKKQK